MRPIVISPADLDLFHQALTPSSKDKKLQAFRKAMEKVKKPGKDSPTEMLRAYMDGNHVHIGYRKYADILDYTYGGTWAFSEGWIKEILEAAVENLGKSREEVRKEYFSYLPA